MKSIQSTPLNAANPAFVTLAALGSGVDEEELGRAFAGQKFSRTDAERVLREAQAQELFTVEDGRIHWRPQALHEATLAIAHLPQARAAARLDASPWTLWGTPRALGNRVRWALYLNDPVMFNSSKDSAPAGWWSALFWGDRAWLDSRKQPLLYDTLLPSLAELFARGEVAPELQAYLREQPAADLQCEIAVMQGDLDGAEAAAKRLGGTSRGYKEMLIFLRGRREEAHAAFQKRIQRRKAAVFASLPALFARLAALSVGDAQAACDLRYESTHYPRLNRFLCEVARHVLDPQAAHPIAPIVETGLGLCLATAVEGLVPGPDRSAARATQRQLLLQRGLKGMADQLGPDPTWGAGLQRQADWQLFLATLRSRGAALGATAAAKPKAATRLQWCLGSSGTLRCVRQKLVRDEWRSDSSAHLQTLIDKPPDYLSEQDRVVLGKLQRSRNWGGEVETTAAALEALIGHPNVLFEGRPCELVSTPLQLEVLEDDNGLALRTTPELRVGQAFALLRLDEDCVGLCIPTPAQSELVEVMGSASAVPESAREQLMESLSPWLGQVELKSELFPEHEGDPRPVVQLKPSGTGLSFKLGVRPQGEEGPFFPTGRGPAEVLGNGVLLKRDLDAEIAALERLQYACATLPPSLQFVLADPDEAVELLTELRSLGAELEWPEKKGWTLHRGRSLSLQAREENGWFRVRGELKVDSGVSMEVGRLLELARATRGRFVRLGEGEFLELTEELKARLTALDELAEADRKGLRVSPLALPALDEGIEGDAAYQAALARFQEAERYNPGVPSTLQAELRDYQCEGFAWMARRAKAGAGACLADDMGLGKTVQTVALLLHNRAEGPNLVVCPTSVLGNWLAQLKAFAPTLTPVVLEGKDRGALLEGLAPGDVVLCSYRILLQDQAALVQVGWNVVVLDEAQFIKNPESKTAKACFELQARVRVATTGTPIENRLAELWSIFRFLNPGLLGSLSSFRRRFEAQTGARQRLRRLVSPFLLRRTKTEVLTELPPRTDITLRVELSPPERALYEKLREEAEAALRGGGADGHIHVLAQLTRLRQACCHPRLLLQDQKLGSAKVAMFLQLADELRQGRHRALVFSQFVELLKLVREQMDELGLTYLYLDGSVPAAERRTLVDRFQNGEADFFLISLKAGGTGLNLTAADYVVHLDPWWNPAVEDQASDRAHRIGQTRPVTVYRLVAQNTLEERVLELHGSKRELARGVLEGADGTGALSQQQMLDLLR
jgi:hypothetical protein